MKQNPSSETDALRSDIDETRRQMDSTMEAIGERLHGGNLFDEVLGFFRRGPSDDGRSRGARIKDSAQHAMHSVADTVKANPWPALLIGAGVAWMIYSSRRGSHAGHEATGYEEAGDDESYSSLGEQMPQAGQENYTDQPLQYGEGESASGGRGKISEATHRLGEKASAIGAGARAKFGRAVQRTRDLGHRGGELARRGGRRVTQTADEHPLELGLACLAAGVLAGLAVPTPAPVNRFAGASMDQMRDRTREASREWMSKGREAARDVFRGAREGMREAGAGFEPQNGPQAGGDTPETPATAASVPGTMMAAQKRLSGESGPDYTENT